MLPGERDRQELLFASDRDPLNERWTGKIASREEVTALTGVHDVLSPRRFAAFTDALFQGGSFSVGRFSGSAYAPPAMPAYLAAVRAGRAEVGLRLAERSSPGRATREQQFAEELRKRYPEIRFGDASPLLTMRETKSPAELALIQRAVDVTVEAQKAAMARGPTATHENWVQATIEFTFGTSGVLLGRFRPSSPPAGTRRRCTTRRTTIRSCATASC
jgi:Xaa-Pro aminopeptidase